MNILDYNASMTFARKEGVAMGTAFGRDEGIALGEARGEARGIAFGRDEVLDLMAKGYNLEQIKDILKGK